jgi:hypothetical protein
MFGRVFREPLVHFLVLALIVFAAYHVLTSAAGEGKIDRIVITSRKTMEIAARSAQVWQRPPTPQELKGLIDEQVKEEIYGSSCSRSA